MYFILIGLKTHLKGCVHTRRDVPLQSTVHTTRPHVTANAGSERELKIFSKMNFFKQPVVALVTFSVSRYTEATRQVLQRTKVSTCFFLLDSETAKNNSLNELFSFFYGLRLFLDTTRAVY